MTDVKKGSKEGFAAGFPLLPLPRLGGGSTATGSGVASALGFEPRPLPTRSDSAGASPLAPRLRNTALGRSSTRSSASLASDTGGAIAVPRLRAGFAGAGAWISGAESASMGLARNLAFVGLASSGSRVFGCEIVSSATVFFLAIICRSSVARCLDLRRAPEAVRGAIGPEPDAPRPSAARPDLS